MKNLGRYSEDLSIPRKKDVDARQAKINVVGPLQGNGNGDVSVAETTPTGTIMIPTGILKGTANGGIEAATPGTDYADVFIIDCTADEADDESIPILVTPSKTYDEVRNAILGQKQCYAQYDGIYYPLTRVSIDAAESNNIVNAVFTVARAGVVIRSIEMQRPTSDTDPVWGIRPVESALRAPASATQGQVMAYRGLRGWQSSNIGTNLVTDFTGIIKGANGKLAQAEAGTDYMPPVAVTSADNGKFLRVVNGAWAAVAIENANGGSF
nr:MAG TPA: hypothetical protein [Caudoviricetes sp.]